jgi:hypothetical protein
MAQNSCSQLVSPNCIRISVFQSATQIAQKYKRKELLLNIQIKEQSADQITDNFCVSDCPASASANIPTFHSQQNVSEQLWN